ncbi:MAG: NAD(+)/NADH kinase, partial [Nitriliruptor sp.]
TLADLDVEVVATAGDADDDPRIEGVTSVPADSFADGLDIAICFGGDGTFLRAAHLCRDPQVPVLGVNLGRLGFLAEVELDDVGPALRAVAEGRWKLEPRATIEVEVTGPDGQQLGSGWALNEVAVEKTERQRLLLMDVHIDGTLFAKVPADALIVATATGSTAYALSAGGPIVSPHLSAVLVVPVAPHSLFDRTFVAAPHETVRVDLLPDQAVALVSCDGREPVAAGPGSYVTARGDGRPVQLARVGVTDFPTLVRRKFGLR